MHTVYAYTIFNDIQGQLSFHVPYKATHDTCTQHAQGMEREERGLRQRWEVKRKGLFVLCGEWDKLDWNWETPPYLNVISAQDEVNTVSEHGIDVCERYWPKKKVETNNISYLARPIL